MASLREIRTKIKSVKSTQPIAKVTPVVWRVVAALFLFPIFWCGQAVASESASIAKTPELYLKEIDVRLNAKDVQGAFIQWSELRTSYPADGRICKPVNPILSAYQMQPSTMTLTSTQLSELLRSCADYGSSPEGVLWERGAKLFNEKQYKDAQKYFDRIILSYPNSVNKEKAVTYSAECKKFIGKGS